MKNGENKANSLSAGAPAYRPVVDYRLLDRLSQESALPCGGELQGLRTAFGTRLVVLSWAFHQEQMSDAVVEDYLSELIVACERQAGIVESLDDSDAERAAVLAYLDGVMDLAEELDALETEQLRDQVRELEGNLAVVYITLQLGVAA